MKLINLHQGIRCLYVFCLLLSSVGAWAKVDLTWEYSQHIDSTIHVGLITCQPSQDEVYSLYGHTAIHFQNTETGVDVAVNYGIFSLNQAGLAFRFLMGTALYTMDIEPFDLFCQHYARERRGIVEQTIHMTAREKLRFAQALMENSEPQNRDYRYDFFYDNCSTRARNIIIRCLEGTVDYGEDNADERLSFRAMTHQYNSEHPWARFGNDILLGLKADRPISQTNAQFLPDYLKSAFDQATVDRGYHQGKESLVDSVRVVVPYFAQTATPEFPLRPRECFLILLAFVVVVTVVEVFSHRHFWLVDALLMAVAGICGIILLMMVFSKHPTVSLNLQLLLLNPLPLFFVWRMIRRSRKHLPDRQYLFWTLLICLFFIGNLWQTYAEGMNIAGAALLVRCLSGVSRNLRRKP